MKKNIKPKPKYKLKGIITMRMYSEVVKSWIYNIKGAGWIKEKNIIKVK